MMEYATLGRTGLKVSRIGYGASGLGNMYTPTDLADGERCLHRAVEEYGINYIDTSPTYGFDCLSEKRLGVILESGLRDQVILASKCGDYYTDNTPQSYTRDYSGKGVCRQVEAQLKRLRTDHLDVLQIHDVTNAPLDYLLEETIPAMQRLQKEGKTRYLGITGAVLPALRYLLEHTDCMDVVLTFGRYNLVDSTLVGYFDDLQKKQNFALLNCSVLFMGYLTKSMLQKKNGYMHFSFFHDEKKFPGVIEALQEASELCDAAGVDIGSLAVQYGCDCPMCDCTLISMSREKRLEQNMELIAKPYDKTLVKSVQQIFAKTNVVSMVWEQAGKQE